MSDSRHPQRRGDAPSQTDPWASDNLPVQAEPPKKLTLGERWAVYKVDRKARLGTVNGVGVYRNGTVVWPGVHPAPIVNVELINTGSNKSTVGRAAGAMLTGGLNLLTPGHTGKITVLITTTSGVHAANFDPKNGTASATKLYQLCREAMLIQGRA